MRLYEVFATPANDIHTIESFEVDGKLSMIDLQKDLGLQGYEFDEFTTLQNYLDHEWIEDNGVTIINDYDIMHAPIHELLDDYKIYELVK